MPSSYYNFRYGGSFTYATPYDPAFYNIIISGDQVWVEPKYITSMFATWGGSVYRAVPKLVTEVNVRPSTAARRYAATSAPISTCSAVVSRVAVSDS